MRELLDKNDTPVLGFAPDQGSFLSTHFPSAALAPADGGKADMSVILEDPQPPKDYLLGSDKRQPEGWADDEPENRGQAKETRKTI